MNTYFLIRIVKKEWYFFMKVLDTYYFMISCTTFINLVTWLGKMSKSFLKFGLSKSWPFRRYIYNISIVDKLLIANWSSFFLISFLISDEAFKLHKQKATHHSNYKLDCDNFRNYNIFNKIGEQVNGIWRIHKKTQQLSFGYSYFP